MSKTGEPSIGIQTLHFQRQVLNREQSADCCGNSVGSALRRLGQKYRLQAIARCLWMPTLGVQVKQNLDMGELRESIQCHWRKGVTIQDDFGDDLAPTVFSRGSHLREHHTKSVITVQKVYRLTTPNRNSSANQIIHLRLLRRYAS